jgi:hypothetical protein
MDENNEGGARIREKEIDEVGEGEKELTSCPAAARERERERRRGRARKRRRRRVARSAFWKKTSRLFEWRTRRVPRLLGSGFCPSEPVAQACTAVMVWAISHIGLLINYSRIQSSVISAQYKLVFSFCDARPRDNKQQKRIVSIIVVTNQKCLI